MPDKRKTKPKSTAKAKTTKSKAKPVSKGLGDKVKKALDMLGVGVIFPNCEGCEKRQEYLNQLFPNLKAFKMTSEQMKIWEGIKPHVKKTAVSGSVNRSITILFNDVFNPSPRVEPVTCSSCWGEIVNRVKKLEQVYQNSK